MKDGSSPYGRRIGLRVDGPCFFTYEYIGAKEISKDEVVLRLARLEPLLILVRLRSRYPSHLLSEICS